MEPVDRRDFMKSVAGATAFGSADFKVAESSDVALPKAMKRFEQTVTYLVWQRGAAVVDL